ncbi:urease accessory protein UreD [Leptolyngbya sp. NIES-2104]|uniref:urease accessory protein UreD n=1 Tax=Leptolyngbya sp. NIES-2104 TaxID=1552121 RepID=UPI00073E4812|nr:urease accessory protein UreD [Leptolyngbya sp. NIES-2104]
MNLPRSVSSDLSPSDWHGRLRLGFENRRGVTQLIENQGQAPLKVQRPFYPEGGEVCHSVIMHTAGGIVGGDRLSFEFRLAPDSQALITTPAASKIYRTNGREARQTIAIDIAERACLEWLPLDAIVFNQASFRQEMTVNLAPGGEYIGWDLTRFGRSARGERFIEGNWRSRTEVWQSGKPIWIDRQWLSGSETTFNSPHGLAGCPIVASFVWIGKAVDSDCVEKARLLWSGTSGEIGVTRLPLGLLCRYRGHSSTEARRWLIDVWGMVRVISGRSICIPRVWQL